MNEILLTSLFLIIGYSAGIFVGMFGIGGGIIFVPVLYLLLPFTNVDVNQISYIVIGTSLFAGGIAALSSGGNHFLSKNVDYRKAFYLALGSVISSYITPFFVISIQQIYLQIIFAVVFSVVAIKMIIENSLGETRLSKIPIKDHYLFLFGLVVGVIASFAGIGGGILYVPILVYLYISDMKKAIGTSAVVTAFTMIASTTSFALQQPNGIVIPYQVGYIYLLAGIPLGIGSALGAILGVKIVLRTSTIMLKKIFSAILILAVLKIILEI